MCLGLAHLRLPPGVVQQFHEDQAYVALQFSDGGIALDSVVLSDAAAGMDVLRQVAHALAGEQKDDQRDSALDSGMTLPQWLKRGCSLSTATSTGATSWSRR